MNNFGELIKYKREQKGMSLNALAKECDINASYVLRLEQSANKQPSFTNVMKLAKALDISQSELAEAFNVEELKKDTEYNQYKVYDIKNYEERMHINKSMDLLLKIKDEGVLKIGTLISLLKEIEEITDSPHNRFLYITRNSEVDFIVELEYKDDTIINFLIDNFSEISSGEYILIKGELLDNHTKYSFPEIVDFFLELEVINQEDKDYILSYYNKNRSNNELTGLI